ncbi:MAG: glycosyltransferase family 4 protein [Gemmatimonadaceae bacterium]|nr:glycosyltransferase family 4 protein [Gemmatimonadaceae bacterium]
MVGPLVGRNPGRVTTQGEILADLFGNSGYDVRAVSHAASRYARLADIAVTVARWRQSVDVLMIQCYGGPSFVVEDVATLLGRWHRRAVVLHLRGGAMPEFFARYPRWTRRVLARADAIVAPSSFLAEAVVPYGFRARVIPNVIDLAAYPFRVRERPAPRLFWMRSFHSIYNPRMALAVLARVRVVRPDATLVMGGQDNGMLAEVRADAERLGLADAVRFPGFLGPEAKRREGDAADVFLSTNHIDNTPVAVIEAAAMGLPVVSTRVGGVSHLIRDGDTGLLVPDGDDAAMAAAVLRILDEPGLAARLSRNGRAMAERSSWEQVRAQWDALFDELAPVWRGGRG